ncbi:MAG: YdcF family protein [Magnetovibrio sp.]|nr:YdcF family protein [Magnetovibrio sp.]
MARPPHRRNSGPTISRIGIFLVLLAGVWGGGLFRYADAIPSHHNLSKEKTDAIVVLTGGSGRLDEGFSLLARGLGKRLFISGVYKGVDVQILRDATRPSPKGDLCCVDIGHDAEDTIGNAVETRDWITQHGYSSLRLVTSAYHMPRSILEFENTLPGIKFIQNPVFPAHVKRKRWWAWPGTTGLIVGEYNKFLMAWVRHRFISVFSQGPAPHGQAPQGQTPQGQASKE